MNNGKKYLVTLPNCKIPCLIVFPKQKIIFTNLVRHKDGKVGGVNFDADNEAQSILSLPAQALHRYLVKIGDHNPWALSKEAICGKVDKNTGEVFAGAINGMTEYLYLNAVNELIEKRYLVPHDVDIGSHVFTENAYYFYEQRQQPEPVEPIVSIPPLKRW